MKVEFKMRPLHVHVMAIVPAEDLTSRDIDMTGVHLAEVKSTVPDGFAAWGALEAFYQKVGLEQPDDFHLAVFDPIGKKYIDEIEPEDRTGIFYTYCDKISDEVPKVTLRLTLDVTYSPNGTDTGELQGMLASMVEYAINKGGLTESTPAEVEVWETSVTEITDDVDVQATGSSLLSCTNEFVLLTQPGTTSDDDLRRTYVPIEATDSDDAERQGLDISSETQIIAVFERVK